MSSICQLTQPPPNVLTCLSTCAPACLPTCLPTWAPAVADGCFKELLPAIQLNGLVTVLPKAVVLQQWGGAGGDEDAALARYEANWGSQGAGVDPISGARSNGFWFQYTFVSGRARGEHSWFTSSGFHDSG